MKAILESIKPIITDSQYVKINEAALEKFAAGIKPEELGGIEYADKIHGLTSEQHIAFAFVYNSIGFCYWGDPKWTVTIKEESFDGSAAMWRCLQRAVNDGYDVLSAKYLRNVPEEDLEKILEGNIKIPLFAERLGLLRKLGKIIQDEYNGSFTSVIDEAEWDSVKLVNLLTTKVTEVFGDEANYHGNTVKFYKRAQLMPGHLVDLYRIGIVPHKMNNYDQLTALADYKVPQLLRKFHVLEYAPKLANKIDKLVELPAGSDEEVEIRSATIWAIELITRIVKKRMPDASPVTIDHILWARGQEKSPDDKPYHRTRTIWY